MANTTFMGLALPTPTVTIGPVWATELNAAIVSIDSHDHSTGNGNQVPTAGINIDADLSIGNFSLTDTTSVIFQSLPSAETGNNKVFVSEGELFFNDGAGNSFALTASGAINVGSVGGFSGDYGVGSSTVVYTDASLTYFFQDSASDPAKINTGDITAESIVATGAITVPTLTVTTGATIASAAITATTGTTTHAGSQIFNGAVTTNAAVTHNTGTNTFNSLAAFSTTTQSGLATFSGAVDIDALATLTAGLIVNTAAITATTGTTTHAGTQVFNGTLDSNSTATFDGGATFNTVATTMTSNTTLTTSTHSGTATFNGLVDINAGATINTAAISATTGTTTHAGTQVFNGAATVNGVATFNAAPVGFGIVPLGAMIPIATNITGSHSMPSTGVMDASGWQLADGASIDGSATLTGTTPDLSDNRFIMGASSSGTAAGTNDFVLTISNIPGHTHGAGSYSTSIGGTFASSTHTHADGTLYAQIGADTAAASSIGKIGVIKTSGTTGAFNATKRYNTPGFGTCSEEFPVTSFACDGVQVEGDTAAPSATSSVTGSNSVTGTSGATGSGTSFNNRPAYVSAQYLIRVK